MVVDAPLTAPGMRALKAERAKNAQLRHQLTATNDELRLTQRQVQWLTRTVLQTSNRLVDTVEAVEQMGKKEGKSNG